MKAEQVRQTFREILDDYLKAGKGRRTISITTDTWTSNSHETFTAVTAHFIDDDWNLNSFANLPF